MKLIIDIPDEVYNAIIHKEFDAKLVVNEMRKSIANGTPLDKIRAEIEQIYTYEHTMFKKRNSTFTCVRLDDVLQIIDKYKAESE